MEFGVWFADELSHILQSLSDTCEDLAAVAGTGSNPQALQAYQAGFHTALRSVARALDIQPPRARVVRVRSQAAKRAAPRPTQPRPSQAATPTPQPASRPRRHLPNP